MKTKFSFIALALAFTFVIVAQQRNTPMREAATAGEPATIISKLTGIVSIRERLADNYRLTLEAGRATVDGTAEIELAEARIELASERGKPDAILTELKGLVAAHERRARRLKDNASDRGSSSDSDRAQAALSEAEVRLLRARR